MKTIDKLFIAAVVGITIGYFAAQLAPHYTQTVKPGSVVIHLSAPYKGVQITINGKDIQ